jgi:hypothetical protein
MSTRTTKKTLIALERTDYVVQSIRVQKPTVTAALGRNFGDSLPEDTPMPDWDALQEAHAVRLEVSAEEIRRAERDYRQKLDQMRGYRKERQTTVSSLIAEYRRLRNSVEGNYPEKALTVLGVEEPPIRRHAAIREQMPEALERLRDAELLARLPAPLPGHGQLDFESFAGPLETHAQALADNMETIQQMRKILDEALLVKRAALKNNRRVYLNLARVQEGYYRLAGLDELAERIRTEVFLLSPRRKPAAEPPSDGTSTEDAPPETAGPPAAATIPAVPEAEPTATESAV